MSNFAIIILLVFTALVLGASTLASQRRLSWRGILTQGLGGLLWASPVIAVLAFVAVRIIPYFQFGTASHHASSGTPSWLETELGGPVEVEYVPSFSDGPRYVPLDLEESSDGKLPEWTSHKVQRLASTPGDPQPERPHGKDKKGKKGKEEHRRHHPPTKCDSEGEQWRIVLESDWEVSPAEAEAQLSRKAVDLVTVDFHRFYPGGSALPAEKIQRAAVRGKPSPSGFSTKTPTPSRCIRCIGRWSFLPKFGSKFPTRGSRKSAPAGPGCWGRCWDCLP